MALSGRSIAVLAYPGYQELEFWYPVLRAREAGATVSIAASSAEGCESYLGYPVLGDVAPTDIDVDTLDALVVPGTVRDQPAISDDQAQLIKSAHAAGRPVYVIGTGAELVRNLVGDVDENRHAADADRLPDLVRRLHAELAVD
jgi:protease I